MFLRAEKGNKKFHIVLVPPDWLALNLRLYISQEIEEAEAITLNLLTCVVPPGLQDPRGTACVSVMREPGCQPIKFSSVCVFSLSFRISQWPHDAESDAAKENRRSFRP